MSPKTYWPLKGVESISIKRPEMNKTYLDVLDILVKRETKGKVRGLDGQIAAASKAFQQTIPKS